MKRVQARTQYYKEHGNEVDAPRNVLNSRFKALRVKSVDWQGSSKWPDKKGRYWWKLKCKNEQERNDFYWMQDKINGYPDANGCYWFTVHCTSETKIEHFSAVPNKLKGYPDKNGRYWHYFQYIESGSIENLLKIKISSFGRSESCQGYALAVLLESLAPAAVAALKDYRKRRENGDKRDNGLRFPSVGFDILDIEENTAQDWGRKWPDKDGRYWWKLKCKDGREINDFYWMKDTHQGRGFPDSNGRYWFTVYHAPSDIKIEGFSVNPDRDKGYPDKEKRNWSYIQYTECGPIKDWMEQKDKNYATRLKQEQDKQSKLAMKRKYFPVKDKDAILIANRIGMWAAPKTSVPPSSIGYNEISKKLPEELFIARAKSNYRATQLNHLSFNKDDELIVLEQQGKWLLCELNGVQGLARRNYLSITSQTAAPINTSCVRISL